MMFSGRQLLPLGLCALLAASAGARPAAVSLSGEWEFRREGESWRTVEVPHDWAVDLGFDPSGADSTGKLRWQGVGHYRRTFDAPALRPGQRAFLEFDGVMASPKVRVNGTEVGGWDYGYASFRVEVGAVLKERGNLVEVTADTRDHKSRWYPGAGIYRDVRFVVGDRDDPDPTTVFITTPAVSRERATVRAEWTTFAGVKTNLSFVVENPRLWDVDDPFLHCLDLGGSRFRYGIRTVEATTDGLHLNGRRVQVKGVCLHADMGPLGMAFNRSVARRQLEIMKEMGVNAIRTSHNCPAPQLLDLCDELGLLVWDECFDKWQGTAGRRPEQNLEEYVSRNLTAFVRRDRNHPCVFCWSTGNEIPPVLRPGLENEYTDPDGTTPERNALFREVIRAADPTRPVAMGCSWTNAVAYGNYDAYDLTGWNYNAYYLPMHARKPRMPLLYSESASALSGYGEYVNGRPAKAVWAPDKPQCVFDGGTFAVDSWDSLAAPWSDIPDVEFARMERDRFVGGEFVWTGIDYLGEPTPWTMGMFRECFTNDFGYVAVTQDMARSSYFGIVDLCGIPKDRYWLYRAYWNTRRETVHVLPHWNWRIGEKVPVFVYTSGDEAELFLNGRSLGVRRKGSGQVRTGVFADPYYAVCDRYRLMWFDIPFEPGELKAVARRKGKVVGEDCVRTCGAATAVRLTPESDVLPDDGETVVFVRVGVVDAKGVADPLSDRRISFSLEGPGRILAVGNGNARGLDSFKAVGAHPLHRGSAVVCVRRNRGEGGRIILRAASEGLSPAEVVFEQ